MGSAKVVVGINGDRPAELRVTILGINYGPETTGVAPYTTRLAQGLQAAA